MQLYILLSPPGIDGSFLSSELFNCIASTKGGNAMIDNLVPAVVVVAAPGMGINPDMLNIDYFYELAIKNTVQVPLSGFQPCGDA